MTAAPGPADSSAESSNLFSTDSGPASSTDSPTQDSSAENPAAQTTTLQSASAKATSTKATSTKDTSTKATSTKTVASQRESLDPQPVSQWIRTLPKKVRIRQKAQRDPDTQLAAFLSQRPVLDTVDTLETIQQQYAGHWQGIAVTEASVDQGQLQHQMAQLAEEENGNGTSSELNWNWRRDWLGLAVSLLFHFGALTLLIIWVLPSEFGDGPLTLNGQIDGIDLNALTNESALSTNADQLQTTAVINRDIPLPFQPTISNIATRRPVSADSFNPAEMQLPTARAANGGGISGRADHKRNALVQKGGGNQASEDAVDRGLKWIAEHQDKEDGGWRFSHKCDCGNPGHCYSRTAATGLALLTFLARNHNHVDQSEYQELVLNGLNFLISTSDKGDLTEQTRFGMYGQGMATLALCEAYAISKDDALRRPAQQAVDFIVQAQHPAGGWRYTPHEIGDLNVTGWQLMALKTAKLAGLDVPDETLVNAKHFVDSQAISNGTKFTYPGLDPDTGQPVPTAIGMLLRMYEGWGPERDEVKYGVSYLAGLNISPNHIYFNYYTTMVMFHYGGDRWDNWNRSMRDFLINTQDSRGHERGSWFFPHNKTGEEGGRLMNTVMSVLILEVYYRHLRLYDDDALVRDFPLD